MKALYRKTSFVGMVYYYVGEIVETTKCKYKMNLTHIAYDDGTLKHPINPRVVTVNKTSVKLI